MRFQLGVNQRTHALDSFGFSLGSTPARHTPSNFIGFVHAPVGTFTGTAPNIGLIIPGNSPFVTYGFRLTPQTDTTARLFFAAFTQNSNIGPLLQNVSVAAIPEPQSGAMLIAGLGLVGAAACRRAAATA